MVSLNVKRYEPVFDENRQWESHDLIIQDLRNALSFIIIAKNNNKSLEETKNYFSDSWLKELIQKYW